MSSVKLANHSEKVQDQNEQAIGINQRHFYNDI